MSGTSQYKKILQQIIKPKVPVKVGQKVEEMTDTQAYRFAELSQGDAETPKASKSNPFEQSRYSLEEAAFRLMVNEDEILQRAAAGMIGLYIEVAGLEGCWRRLDDNGDSMESSVRMLKGGYLALTAFSCRELTLTDGIRVLVAELPELPVPSALELDGETMQELSAWGRGKKCFCLSEPKTVGRKDVVLLAPPGGSSA